MSVVVSTREKLLDVAARLYSERGVFAVSLSEIVRASGQRNASAMQYHVGDRDAVLVALLEPNVRFIGERRRELLDHALAAPPVDRRVVVEALVRPVTELAERGWRERAFLRIGLDVADHPGEVGREVTALVRRTAGHEAYELLAKRSPELGADIVRARVAICVELLGRAASQRARSSHDGGAGTLSGAQFVENLIDMVLGAFTAPVTET
ncbi:MAG: hypothetical protein RIB98_11730 [Acidimicrobiales bacterium]